MGSLTSAFASLSQQFRNPFVATTDASATPQTASERATEVFIKHCCIINKQAYTPIGAFIIALARWRIKSQTKNIDWYRDVLPALKRRGVSVDGDWVCGVLLASEQP